MVSIAIVAVLIGISFPVFQGAVESARGVRCMSNLRSLVTGLGMYREDHDGDLPWAIARPTVEYPKPFKALLPYLDANLPVGTLGEEIERIEPFTCPSDRDYALATGFSYAYLPSSFMQVMGTWDEVYEISDMRYILNLYEGPKAQPVFSDAYRFHIKRSRWADFSAPDRTGSNLAYLDGSVRKGEEK